MAVGLAMLFGALALGILAAPGVAAWLDRQRCALPRLTVLCMSFERPRQARLELRVDRPARAPDWSIRRIEWLAPQAVTISPEPDSDETGTALETDLRPSDPAGRWLNGQASFWARYPRGAVPTHVVRLRVTLESANGARHRRVITEVFPAIDWTGVSDRSAERQGQPSPVRDAALARAAAPELEARSWAIREWTRRPVEGVA